MATKKVFNKKMNVYANELREFLRSGKYSTSSLILLGVIASRSRRKHTKLIDEIKTAITDLALENIDGFSIMIKAEITQ